MEGVMAIIDLDKIGTALSYLRDNDEGVEALRELKASMDIFISSVQPDLNHSEAVFLFRTLMSDLSIDEVDATINVGAITSGDPSTVQQLGDSVINVHGFRVKTNK